MKFYIYALYSSENLQTPFYIGKGSGKRIHAHFNRSQKACARALRIEKIFARGEAVLTLKQMEGLSEQDAFAAEKIFISYYGRVPNGPLINFTDGGEGPSGWHHSAETKEKLKQAGTGRQHSSGAKEKMKAAGLCRQYSQEHKEFCRSIGRSEKTRLAGIKANTGRKHSIEERRRQSVAQKGKSLSADHRRSIGAAQKGKPKPIEQRLKLSISNARTAAFKRELARKNTPI